MKLTAEIDFWDDGVVCFCHEALMRALAASFPGVQFAAQDLALQKYQNAKAFESQLEPAAWSEFLRSGPRYRFALPSGTTGVISRYRIDFEVPDSAVESDVPAVRQFLQRLTSRPIRVHEE